jgi:hypothetical protein
MHQIAELVDHLFGKLVAICFVTTRLHDPIDDIESESQVTKAGLLVDECASNDAADVPFFPHDRFDIGRRDTDFAIGLRHLKVFVGCDNFQSPAIPPQSLGHATRIVPGGGVGLPDLDVRSFGRHGDRLRNVEVAQYVQDVWPMAVRRRKSRQRNLGKRRLEQRRIECDHGRLAGGFQPQRQRLVCVERANCLQCPPHIIGLCRSPCLPQQHETPADLRMFVFVGGPGRAADTARGNKYKHFLLCL